MLSRKNPGRPEAEAPGIFDQVIEFMENNSDSTLSTCPCCANGASWDVGYEMSGSAYAGWNARQSPPASIEYPAFQLSPPVGTSPVPSAPGNAFTCEGGVQTTGTPGSTQNVQLRVIDNDVWPNPDDLLVDVAFSQSIPAASFSGALIPCTHDVNLFKDSGGSVAGADGSSGETSAEVFQELSDIGEHSGMVTVTVGP
jgi:hypothetical protein